jgi:hypothetical protein
MRKKVRFIRAWERKEDRFEPEKERKIDSSLGKKGRSIRALREDRSNPRTNER